MIDTEGKKKVQYQLRRQGKPATKPNVRDIMKLTKEVTKFGRHSANDYYLDSADLDCFISRWHAEIHRVMQNNEIHFVLRDCSLNGTYVNNHRVLGSHLLKVQEVLCFGHTNGKNLKPGDFAPQMDSEFEFIFEVADPDQDSELEEAVREQRSRPSPLVDSTTDISSPTIPALAISSMLNNDQSQGVAKPSTAGGGGDKSSPVLQDISNKKDASSPGLLPLDQFATTTTATTATVPSNITVVTQDRVFSGGDQAGLIQDAAITSEQQDTPRTRGISSSESVGGTSTTSSSKARKKRAPKSRGPPNKKAKQRKPKPLSTDKEEESEELSEEDDDWHYEGDRCDAFNCRRPKSKKVSWVQCDDCDDWYHTTCAGCNYDAVRSNNAEFHCGCTD